MPSNPNGAVEAIALPISELEKFEKGQPYSAGNATFIPNGIDPDGRRKGSFLSGMAVFQHQVSPSTSYRAGYQVVDTRRGYTDGPQGPGRFEPGPGDKSNFNGLQRHLPGETRPACRQSQSHLRWLMKASRSNYLSFDGGAYGVSASNQIDLKQRSHAIYVQDQLSLLDSRLQFTAAGRAQFFDLKQPNFQGTTTNPYENQIGNLDVPTAYTGDGALAYLMESIGTKFRAHVGNSFRAPSGYERFGGGFGSYYGDPRLARNVLSLSIPESISTCWTPGWS
jgi:iron complex outermembrane receptor protein